MRRIRRDQGGAVPRGSGSDTFDAIQMTLEMGGG